MAEKLRSPDENPLRPKLRPDWDWNQGGVGGDSAERTEFAVRKTAFPLRGRGQVFLLRVLSIRWLRVRVPSASLRKALFGRALCIGKCVRTIRCFWNINRNAS